MTQVVVVTGASGGIGRAVVREFGRRGAKIGLIARGEAGLRAAADEVRSAGGESLVLPLDVADAEAVHQAAADVEDKLGPIDVWINVAFSSVFAPFSEITPAEFRRATEVSYLGYVHGTMAALRSMKPRDRGTIVQVGSALAYRGIPSQSAYCGAKHAIQGFNESLRCELLHENSNVHTTMVQMPAVNTPQFSWVRSKLPHQAPPVPPIFEPEVAARAVLWAADHQSGESTGWAAPPSPHSWPTPSPPACSTATWRRPDSRASRPINPGTAAGRRTCGSRPTARAEITARTGSSTIARPATLGRCGRPSIMAP